MLIVIVNSNIEKALKTLKSKVIKTKQSQILNGKKAFTKKSVVRRKQKLSAIYKQKLNSLD
jgi:ribosomal protein S21